MSKKLKLLLILIPVIVLVIIIGFIVHSVANYTNTLKQFAIFRAEYDKAMATIGTGEQIDMTIHSEGEISKLEKYFKENFDEVSKKIERVTVAATSFPLLDIKSLETDDRNLSMHKATLVDMRAANDEYYTSLIALFDAVALEDEIDALEISDKDRQEIKDAFLPVYNEWLDVAIELRALTVRANNKMDEAITLLASNSSKWEIDNSILRISDNNVLTKYNAIITELTTIQAELLNVISSIEE